MALQKTGLITDTYEEVLTSIIEVQQSEISPSIAVGDDTLLGQFNKIFTSEIASVNELLQDIYDQRDIHTAEGKALDDNISWLGLSRQNAAATSGQTTFTGDDGTTVPTGSFLQSTSTLENFTLDTAININRSACLEATLSVKTVDDGGYDYTVSVGGSFSVYTSQALDTDTDIIAGLIAQIETDSAALPYDVDPYVSGDTTLRVFVTDAQVTSVTLDANLKTESITSVGNITGVNTGAIPATANTVTTILSPVSGWKSTNNINALIIGRAEETDPELRDRALTFRSTSGKATVDAIKAAILDLDGVASVAINEQFVSAGVGDALVTVDTSEDTTTYTVTILGVNYDYTSGVSESTTDIATGLQDEINNTTTDDIAASATTNEITISSKSLYRLPIEVSDDGAGDNLTLQEGQPSGSIQVVVSGGSDNNEIAQTIWDTKAGGVEVWAVGQLDPNTGTNVTEDVFDASGEPQVISFNRPTSIDMTVTITYTIFDSTVYPADNADAVAAVQAAVVSFGNLLAAGEDVIPSEFEGAVYSAVAGIHNVFISMTCVNGSADSSNPVDSISIGTDEESFFSAANISVN